ncbi:hypothetical protein HRR83_000745 [Exophiala dermatitidis]|uniref:Alpha-galactosidase A n=1 Tax=Exophiala dermatitidis TaxID=5970 RepID=A0AAN6F454_EXODE|nr:hypothetical protein HRR75_000674 [Exophiala dermatitidis]KAJ4527994.1 hypothetical protein HRR74_000749 [Exophiala dermatitidis]KAJ4528627.1 hypothetical protein HRR73_001250 [Exophiala dermatitidis]KAJ4530003.1 hypothetical protein HRR76_009246 [Exophiala dermatitidis]KAJ4552971.1 hypothetical protein HRR78_003230 [Exophiala dermatitidis]
MSRRDVLLDLDLSPSDCLYRLQREENDTARVIYVHVANIDLLPEESQTSGFELIRDLSRFSGWDDSWDTLTISKDGDTDVQCVPNAFKLHAIPQSIACGPYPLFNILDLQVLTSKKPRVAYVTNGTEQCYLKYARFAFEIQWTTKELGAYHALAQKNSRLAPQLLGYVFEGSGRRIIGFLLEALVGRPANVTDEKRCEEALQSLHELGITHGDPNKENILITGSGPRFIDLEDSAMQPLDNPQAWDAMKNDDLCKMKMHLRSSSDVGCSWS